MTYLVHLPSLSYWVRTRSVFSALAMAEKHPTGNFRQLMREQVGSFDVKLQNVYGMVARVKAPFGVRGFFSAVAGRRDTLTLKPNRTIGCGSPTPKPFNTFCKLRATIS